MNFTDLNNLESVNLEEVVPEGVKKALELASEMLEENEGKSGEDVSEVSIEVASAIITKLHTMLSNTGNADGVALTMADLKDMTAMLKDLTAFLTKVKGEKSDNASGLDGYLARRKL